MKTLTAAIWTIAFALTLGACGVEMTAMHQGTRGKADDPRVDGLEDGLVIVETFNMTPQSIPHDVLVFGVDLLIDKVSSCVDPGFRIALADGNGARLPLRNEGRIDAKEVRMKIEQPLEGDPCYYTFEAWYGVPLPRLSIPGPLTAKLFMEGRAEPIATTAIEAWLPPPEATFMQYEDARESKTPLILLTKGANGHLGEQYYSRPVPSSSCPTGDSPCSEAMTILGDASDQVLVYAMVPPELSDPRLCIKAVGQEAEEAETEEAGTEQAEQEQQEQEPCIAWVARQYADDGPRYIAWPEPEHQGVAPEQRNSLPLVPITLAAGKLYEAWIVADVAGEQVEQPALVYYGRATRFQNMLVDRARFMSTTCGPGSALTDGACTCAAGLYNNNGDWLDGCEATEPPEQIPAG